MTRAWSQWEGRLVNGEFHLQKHLGGSADSAVFLTEHGSEPAAIKLALSDPPGAQRKLERWRLAQALSHPHLVRILKTGRCQLDSIDMVFMVMEYAEENLEQILPQRALAPPEMLQILGPALDVLAYLHGQGLAHGGLHPANIMAHQDQLKLASDCVCKAGEPFSGLGRDNPYDPPEKKASPESDVWSLGITLAVAFTQSLPAWNELDQADPVLPDGIPVLFSEVVRGCLHRDPQHRWTLADIAGRLDLSLKSYTTRPAAASASPTPKTPPAPAPAPVPAPTLTPSPTPALSPTLTPSPTATPSPTLTPSPTATPSPAPTRPKQSTPAPAPTKAAPALPRQRRLVLWGVLAVVPLIALFMLLAHWLNPSPEHRGAAAPADSNDPKASKDSGSKPSPTAGSRSTGRATIVNRVPGESEVVQQVLPDVSQPSLATIQGTVRVRVRVQVDGSGKVVGSDFESRGPSSYFAERSMQAAQKWRFTASGPTDERAFLLRFEFTGQGARAFAARIER